MENLNTSAAPTPAAISETIIYECAFNESVLTPAEIFALLPADYVAKYKMELSEVGRLVIINDWDRVNVNLDKVYKIHHQQNCCLTINAWNFTLTIWQSNFFHLMTF